MNFLKQITSLIVLFLLAFPSAVFSASQADLSAQKIPAADFSVVRIQVVSEKTQNNLKIQTSTAKAQSDCKFLGPNENSLVVQGGGAINLNQPASCFELKEGKLANVPEFIEISTHEPAYPAIIVVRDAELYTSPQLSHSSPKLPTPLIAPGVLSVIPMMFWYLQGKLDKNKIKPATVILESLSLHKLAMLRC